MHKIISQIKNKLWLILSITTPLLFAVSPSLYSYSKNYVYYNIGEMLISILIFATASAVFFGIIYLCCHFFLKSKNLQERITCTSVVTSLLFLLFYVIYGPVKQIVGSKIDEGYLIGNFVLGCDKLLFPMSVGLFVWFILFVVKNKIIMLKIQRFLSVMCIMLVSFSIFTIFSKPINSIEVKNVSLEVPINKVNENLPNIYYIILDAYSSFDVLKKYYGYNNDAFLEYLKRKGFYVAEKSRCNYPITMLSLRSSLNMEINRDNNHKLIDRDFAQQSIDAIRNNKIARLLINEGYSYYPIGHHFFSNFSPKLKNTHLFDTKYFSTSSLWIKELLSTPLEHMSEGLDDNNVEHLYKNIQLTFDQLEKTSLYNGKKFVFAHILCPHPPFIFNSDGTLSKSIIQKKPKQMLNEKYVDIQRKSYVAQLEFTTNTTIGIIDKILQRDTGAIIIIQSDHGGWVVDTLDDKHDFTRDTSFIAQRMPILNAYHVPQKIKNLLYDSISPINSFRIILNCILDQKLSQLSDDHFVIYAFDDKNIEKIK